MEPQVVAAWVAAGASAISAAIAAVVAWRVSSLSNRVQTATADRTIENQLVVAALNSLVGGSQTRAAGLAALGVLRSSTESTRWRERYEPSVQGLVITQLVFVLTAGTNRWEAHEVQNVRTMVEWLSAGGRLAGGADQPVIMNAVTRYRDDWARQARVDHKKYEDGGVANQGAVQSLLTDLDTWSGMHEDR